MLEKCFWLKSPYYAKILCTFTELLIIPFGHHLSHMTLDTKDFPRLDAYTTCSFFIPSNCCIEGSNRRVFWTGAPRRCLPIKLHTGMVIACAIFLEGRTRGAWFSTCKNQNRKEYIAVGTFTNMLLLFLLFLYLLFLLFLWHSCPKAWATAPFCPL